MNSNYRENEPEYQGGEWVTHSRGIVGAIQQIPKNARVIEEEFGLRSRIAEPKAAFEKWLKGFFAEPHNGGKATGGIVPCPDCTGIVVIDNGKVVPHSADPYADPCPTCGTPGGKNHPRTEKTWLMKFLEQSQAEPELSVCPTCGGTRVVDSGGVTPWGSAIDRPCPACTEDQR